MPCRGVLFAIDNGTVRELIAAKSDANVRANVRRVENAWDSPRLAEMDKAWDAMHRTLSDGSLDPSAGAYPLNRVILGGRHLYQGDDYIVALVPANEIKDVARAVTRVEQPWFRERYLRLLSREDYGPEHGEVDLAYTWAYLEEAARLYARAARERRAVIFTVDQ
jgi:hypothetical protein